MKRPFQKADRLQRKRKLGRIVVSFENGGKIILPRKYDTSIRGLTPPDRSFTREPIQELSDEKTQMLLYEPGIEPLRVDVPKN